MNWETASAKEIMDSIYEFKVKCQQEHYSQSYYAYQEEQMQLAMHAALAHHCICHTNAARCDKHDCPTDAADMGLEVHSLPF